MPLHVRPVVSGSELRKGRVERPRSGLDRLSLTDVGKWVIEGAMSHGLTFRVKNANPPFPWVLEVSNGADVVMEVRGHLLGPSTFRSIFVIRIMQAAGGKDLLRSLMGTIDRDPLSSPYWDMETWSVLESRLGLTRDELERRNGEVGKSVRSRS